METELIIHSVLKTLRVMELSTGKRAGLLVKCCMPPNYHFLPPRLLIHTAKSLWVRTPSVA